MLNCLWYFCHSSPLAYLCYSSKQDNDWERASLILGVGRWLLILCLGVFFFGLECGLLASVSACWLNENLYYTQQKKMSAVPDLVEFLDWEDSSSNMFYQRRALVHFHVEVQQLNYNQVVVWTRDRSDQFTSLINQNEKRNPWTISDWKWKFHIED